MRSSLADLHFVTGPRTEERRGKSHLSSLTKDAGLLCKRHGPCTRKHCGGDHLRPGLRFPRAAGTELRPVLPDSWGLRKEQATSPKQRTLALSGIKAATVLRVGSLKDAFESTRKRMSFDTSKSQSNSTSSGRTFRPSFPVLHPVL